MRYHAFVDCIIFYYDIISPPISSRASRGKNARLIHSTYSVKIKRKSKGKLLGLWEGLLDAKAGEIFITR